LMNTSTFRYSGLVHTKSIGVTPSVDKKGVIFVYKKAKKYVSVAYVTNPLNFS
jgi:large subunit ribosomal protein L28e